MDPDNELAVQNVPLNVGTVTLETIVISNNNLYFFSWGSFIMSFYVLFGFLQNFGKIRGPQVYAWAGLTMTSFVVLVTASRQYDDWYCDKDDLVQDDQCKRTSLAVGVGVISGLVGLVWAFLGSILARKCNKIAVMLDFLLAWFIFVLWIFAIIYVTFGGQQAAARALGNLYFFTWASFCLSTSMAMQSIKGLFNRNQESADGDAHEEEEQEVKVPAPKEAPRDEAVVEVLPEDQDERLSEVEA